VFAQTQAAKKEDIMTNNKPTEYHFKIEQKELEGGKIQLIVTVPAQTMRDVLKSAAYMLALQNKMDLEGVDKEDMIPLVIETVGEAQYYAFASQYSMNAAAPHAIMQRNIEPAMEPELSSSGQVVLGRDFTFVAVVTPKPHFKLSSYDPVTIKVSEVTITEEEIDQQILNVARQNAEIVPDEDAEVEDGTEMVFAIKTNFKDNNEPVEKLTAERRYHQTGKRFLPEGFDEALMGMRPGDSRTFDFELPVAYSSEGKPTETRTVTTTIDLLQIEKSVIPAITDAWVKEKMPEARDVDGLREMLRAEGLLYKEQEQKNMETFAAASALAERFEGTINDEIYDSARVDMLAGFKDQLRKNGISLEQYMQDMGVDTQQFNMMLMMQVRQALRQGYSLDALARHLKLVLTEEDITEALRKMAPGDEERARFEFEQSGRMYMLKEAAMRSKANAWLVETATYEPEEPA